MIVVTDFDGTLTIEDVTTYVWDKHLRYDWRAELLPPTYAGTWTPLQMIARGYADIPVPPDAAPRRGSSRRAIAPGARGTRRILPSARLAAGGRQPRSIVLHRGATADGAPRGRLRRDVYRVGIRRLAPCWFHARAGGGLQEPDRGGFGGSSSRSSDGLPGRRSPRSHGCRALRSRVRRARQSTGAAPARGRTRGHGIR